jgi:hypothetical protein
LLNFKDSCYVSYRESFPQEGYNISMSYTPRLKNYQHYADLYDKFTVEECRRFIKMGSDLADKNNPPDSEYLKDQVLNQMGKIWTDVAIEIIKGERYASKEKAIREWMSKDEEIDKYYEESKAPEEITCLTCGRIVYEMHKEIETDINSKKIRVLYMLECPLKHLPRRAFYDDGQEYRHKEPECKKCRHITRSSSERNGDVITTTYSCGSCGHEEIDTLNLKPKKVEEVIDVDFIKDREEFCLTKEEGDKYVMSSLAMKSYSESKKTEEERNSKYTEDVREKVKILKKLTILELEELINDAIKDTQFVRLQFKDPVTDRDLYVPFIVYDTNATTNPKASEHDLSRLINKVTKDTNWRLMSDGINYRLGMLTGRLRAYEREEDILELVRVRNKK